MCLKSYTIILLQIIIAAMRAKDTMREFSNFVTVALLLSLSRYWKLEMNFPK